jgi:hypothetical protein
MYDFKDAYTSSEMFQDPMDISPKGEGGGNSMPIYVFRIQVAPDAEPELKEIAAVDFVTAVQTLAAWCPGVHIIKLEGICTVPAAVA